MVLVKGGFTGSLESTRPCYCGCITEPPNPPEGSEAAVQAGIANPGFCACFCGVYDYVSPRNSASAA